MTQTLYAAKGGSAASDLYTIDPATGAETSVGPTGVGITGLAFAPDSVLYAVTSAASPGGTSKRLYTIDPATGTATLIGSMGVTVPDIAFDSGGNLYGWQSGGGNPFVSIDPATAAVTPISGGVPSVSGGGISIDSGGTAYTAFENNPQHLETVDLGTGIPTDLGAITGIGPANAAGFTFDELDVLWAIFLQSGTATLFTVPTTTTPTATSIGSMASNMDALAWGPGGAPPVIEPGLDLASVWFRAA